MKNTQSCMGQRSEIILTCKILIAIILKKYNLFLLDLKGLSDFLIVKNPIVHKQCLNVSHALKFCHESNGMQNNNKKNCTLGMHTLVLIKLENLKSGCYSKTISYKFGCSLHQNGCFLFTK